MMAEIIGGLWLSTTVRPMVHDFWWYFLSRLKAQPDAVVNAYTACASNLRTLSLTATPANFTALFPPNASALTSLEEFTLAFSQDNSSADAEAVSTFFQAISSTLSSLIILFHCTSDEPSRLLQNSREGGQVCLSKT